MVTEYGFDEAVKDLDHLMDIAVNDHTPVRIKGKLKGGVVVIDAEDYDSMEETFYLLKSPQNAARLLNALKGGNKVSFESIQDLRNEIGI
jgi:antitoxin YefM